MRPLSASTNSTTSTTAWSNRSPFGSFRRDPALLIGILVVVTGIVFFWWLTDQVVSGRTNELDRRLIRACRTAEDAKNPIGPHWLEEAARDITALGGYAVLSGLTVSVSIFLVIVGKQHAGWLLLGATTGGLTLMHLLKSWINRPRPDPNFVSHHLSLAGSASFPSGHAMLSAIVYLALGAMLARLVQRRRLKTFFITLALGLSFLIGISRVYLGVHYPTDIIAGWTAGLVWGTFCWILTRALQRSGAVELDIGDNPAARPID